ncbi:MAG TPA: ribonuclease HI family protein [Candidatus Paceibacterota bacterium]|nr:ribonuclease HI family protein [Candidatus Paceibacterota bacterium]
MKENKSDKIIIYTDGGSRGNPGPAALGVYFETLDKSYGEYLGEATNNNAEYQAVVFALKKCKQVIGKEKARDSVLEIRSDSQLIVNQLNAQYQLKEKDLWEYFIAIWNLKQEYKDVIFTHILREKNKIADLLVNQVLDEKASKKLF